MTSKFTVAGLLFLLLASQTLQAVEDGVAEYFKDSVRWEKSIIDMNFLKDLINDKNCESSFQVFSGCVLALEEYAGMNEQSFPLYKSLAEAQMAQSTLLKKSTMEESLLIIRDQSAELPVGAKVVFEASPLKLISTSSKALGEQESPGLTAEGVKKLDPEKVLDLQKSHRLRTLARLKAMYAQVISEATAKSSHPIEKIFAYLQSQKKGTLTKFAISRVVNEYLLNARDPHSSIKLVKSEREQFENPSKNFVGIGVELGFDEQTKLTEVREVFPETGAYEAGVHPGDLLKKVNEVSLEGKSINDVVSMVRGGEGTAIQLTVIRDGKPVELKVTRKKVVISTVKAYTLTFGEMEMGYAKLSGFSNIEECQRLAYIYNSFENDPNVKGAILDFRGNPGGDVRVANCISGLFLGPGVDIAFFTYDQKNHLPQAAMDRFKVVKPLRQNDETVTTSQRKLFSKALVVLINEGSASASELVASAFRDRNRALLMGNVSFGKASSMTSKLDSDPVKPGTQTKDLPEEMTMLMGTSGLFFSPSGRTHQGSGVTPHLKVYRGLEPSLGERIASGGEDRFLFPLQLKAYKPPYTEQEIKAMDQLKVPTKCMAKADLPKVYNSQAKGYFLRDMQMISGLAALWCLEREKVKAEKKAKGEKVDEDDSKDE